VSYLGLVNVVDGSIVLKIVEEKDEITFIDELSVRVGGVEIHAAGDSRAVAKAAERDQDYLVIAPGGSYEFSFRLPGPFADSEQATVWVVASGFYAPLTPSRQEVKP
jgi:hypothetical protein